MWLNIENSDTMLKSFSKPLFSLKLKQTYQNTKSMKILLIDVLNCNLVQLSVVFGVEMEVMI